MTTEFAGAFETFMEVAQERSDADYVAFRNGHGGNPPKLTAEYGRRYVRIVSTTTDGSSRSAWAFVDITTGDVLKPEGWKGPAKGRRGNIYNIDHGTDRVRWTGIR